jgi:hypothetical protein
MKLRRMAAWIAIVSGAVLLASTNGGMAASQGVKSEHRTPFIPGYHTLIIGEDSGDGHQNDMIWSLNIVTGALTRIQTTPYGSETTSPYFYPNINGHAYIMSVIQHPYGESDSDKLVDPSGERAYTGYLGPLPPMDGSAE